MKEGASIEASNQELRTVPHWAFHRIDGRSTVGKGRTWNISGSICSVFRITGEPFTDIRLVAEYVECCSDSGTDRIAPEKM